MISTIFVGRANYQFLPVSGGYRWFAMDPIEPLFVEDEARQDALAPEHAAALEPGMCLLA
jgi:hypothetical protein